jgi:hypothetical protein
LLQVLYQKGVAIKHVFWGIAAGQLVMTFINTFLHWKQTQELSENEKSKTERDDNGNTKHEIQVNGKGIFNFENIIRISEQDKFRLQTHQCMKCSISASYLNILLTAN